MNSKASRILAAIMTALILVFGTVLAMELHSIEQGQQKIEQLQTDTNDNLCNQSAYQGGITCEGGDANAGQ
jgi:hypothetical protein